VFGDVDHRAVRIAHEEPAQPPLFVGEWVDDLGSSGASAFPTTTSYTVCAVLRAGDDPAAFGAERGTLPGGRYACVRLHGVPPGVYEQIGPTAERLAQRPDADSTRPTLEYYRRRNVIDVLAPVV
jgi:hypothetical protein